MSRLKKVLRSLDIFLRNEVILRSLLSENHAPADVHFEHERDKNWLGNLAYCIDSGRLPFPPLCLGLKKLLRSLDIFLRNKVILRSLLSENQAPAAMRIDTRMRKNGPAISPFATTPAIVSISLARLKNVLCSLHF